jgi:hypothetical protein
MDTFEKAKTAIAEPGLSDLEQEKILFAERTAEVEAADAELKSADHAVWVCKNQRLPELEAHRDAVGRKRDHVLEQFAEAKENLRKKGVSCG